jgi:hypothetical protein
MTGKQVLASVIAIILATAVVPPAAAWAVNHQRVARADREVAAIAEALSARPAELARVRSASAVLAGPGEMPAANAPDVQMWLLAPRAGLEVVLPETEASRIRGATPIWSTSRRTMVSLERASVLCQRARTESSRQPSVRIGRQGMMSSPGDREAMKGHEGLLGKSLCLITRS